MITYEDLRIHLGALEERLLAKLQTIVEFTPIARTSADGSSDSVNVQGDPKDRQRTIRRVSPWGISGRPVAGAGVLAAIVKAVGGAFGGMNVGIASGSYGPQDLDEGETAIWNKVDGTLIRLKADGSMTIDAGDSADIVVNGGTAKIARVGDLVVGNTTMLAWISAVSTVLNTAGPVVGAPGTVTVPTDFGKINTGADHFKG